MLIATDLLDPSIEIGELLVVVNVSVANVVKDVRENIKNLTGGRMMHYEKLTTKAIEAALQELEEKAKAKGYDGVIGIKISTPQVAQGAVELLVYGNGFHKIKS